jgi:hypothetical protein
MVASYTCSCPARTFCFFIDSSFLPLYNALLFLNPSIVLSPLIIERILSFLRKQEPYMITSNSRKAKAVLRMSTGKKEG